MAESVETLTFEEGQERAARTSSRISYLVLAVECLRPLQSSTVISLDSVGEVIVGRSPERSLRRSGSNGSTRWEIESPDEWMSSRHARMFRDGGVWLIEDRGSKNGTFVNSIRCKQAQLADGDLIEVGSTLFLFRDIQALAPKHPVADGALPHDGAPLGVPTLCPSFWHELRSAARVASSTVPVLVRGESGTGKELVARTIHEQSGRTGPFVAVNCGALPESLLESELFGFCKGAFSGANEDRNGLVQAADGGTLFLDEIAELSEPSQVALLRVLQDGRVTPVGTARAVDVDFRLIAATHQDLEARMSSGQFRADLYARITGHQLSLPALRDRREDLGLLLGALLGRLAGARADGLRLHRKAARALFTYCWPLNIRELEHALHTAIAVGISDEIILEHLPEQVRWALREHHRDVNAVATDSDELKERLLALMRLHRGNVSAVAREMGKARMQIHRWSRRFGIDVDSFRPAQAQLHDSTS